MTGAAGDVFVTRARVPSFEILRVKSPSMREEIPTPDLSRYEPRDRSGVGSSSRTRKNSVSKDFDPKDLPDRKTRGPRRTDQGLKLRGREPPLAGGVRGRPAADPERDLCRWSFEGELPRPGGYDSDIPSREQGSHSTGEPWVEWARRCWRPLPAPRRCWRPLAPAGQPWPPPPPRVDTPSGYRPAPSSGSRPPPGPRPARRPALVNIARRPAFVPRGTMFGA